MTKKTKPAPVFRREDIRELIMAARRAWPIGILLSERNGVYRVVGHGFDRERGEVNVHYKRGAGLNFDPLLEEDLVYDRPISQFSEDRFREVR